MAMKTGSGSKKAWVTENSGWYRFAGTAECPRCGGLMVSERCVDVLDDTGRLHFSAGRCIQCGEVIDPVILRNRRTRAAGGVASRG
jgi:hypothetical protein